MKRHGPLTHFRTPAQDAMTAPGYVASGEGQFSRRSANPAEHPVSMVDSPRDEPKPHVHLLMHELIAKNDRELSHIQRRLCTEADPERRKKLLRDREIKSRFLSRLYAQQMKAKRRDKGH